MFESLTVQDWQQFLLRYDKFTEDHTRRCFEEFRDHFERLKAEWQIKTKLSNELKREHGSDFNLFRLLGVERREVTTHSALLADLFNPNGTHCQNELFLQTFLRYCSQKFDYTFLGHVDWPNEYTWFVDRERVTAFGHLDIVVSCPEQRFLLVIENKIDADEQPDQLARYEQWMHSQQAYYPNQLLIYLTPDGREAYTAHGAEYCLMSYRQDIALWLRQALCEVRAPRIRQVILQYLEIVETI